MKYELTCINCPMGCRITADYDGKEVTNIQGYTCARGKAYAQTEITDPTRMVTALVGVEGRRAPLSVTALVGVEGTHAPLSVKTRSPIRKPLIFDALRVIRETTVRPPVRIGDVVVENVCNSGVDVIATENIEA